MGRANEGDIEGRVCERLALRSSSYRSFSISTALLPLLGLLLRHLCLT